MTNRYFLTVSLNIDPAISIDPQIEVRNRIFEALKLELASREIGNADGTGSGFGRLDIHAYIDGDIHEALDAALAAVADTEGTVWHISFNPRPQEQ